MEALIQVRRGTAAQWISANPILATGEPGLETDTGKGKYGDGTKHWSTLGYSWSLLANGPQGPAGGSLTGNYPNPTLQTNTVGAPQIIDSSVDTAELKDLAVKTAKLDNLAVTTAKIGDGQVTPAKLSGSIGSAQIADGSIALADLAPATVSALKVDVLDEGAVSLADADKINFVGEGVAVASGAGVATVTITGAPASAIIPGTIVDWADSVAPAGWHLCDGAVQADMAGTLGTRYGATAGTTPFFFPVPEDADEQTTANIVTGVQAGWRIDGARARRIQGNITLYIQCTRTGADIPLGAPNHADQSICSVKAPWIPDFAIAGSCANTMRMGYVSAGGAFVITSGLAYSSQEASDINRDDVHTFSWAYGVPPNQVAPRIYKIIKAP